jgi:hypothetical protein
MMPRADKYKILQSDLIEGLDEAATKATEKFTDAVNELLRQGWEVHGPLVAVTVQKPRVGHVLYQPMLKMGERG